MDYKVKDYYFHIVDYYLEEIVEENIVDEHIVVDVVVEVDLNMGIILEKVSY